MASVSITLPDIEQSVARPAIFKILQQVFEITQLPKDTDIHYVGKRGGMQTAGSSIDDESLSDSSRDAQFAAKRYAFIDVTEQYQLGAMQEIFTHAYEHIPIFEDPALRLSMSPIYTTSDVTIAIRYRSVSETECRRWMAEMLLRTSRGRDLNLHDIEYTYPIPLPYLNLIEDVWTRREAIAGYNQPFEDYFTRHASDRLTVVSNRAGEGKMLMVSEKQMRIQGYFDFQGVPEAPTRDDSGTWEISFNYRFSYQRPDAAVIHYPIVVHNQLLPEKYLGLHVFKQDPEYRGKYYSHSYNALAAFECDTALRGMRPEDSFLRLPSFDDFTLNYPNPIYGTVFTALTTLDDDRQVLLNLKELGDLVIDVDILEYMAAEASYMTWMYKSFFRLSLHCGDEEQPDGSIELLPDLTVRATAPLDLRKVYHVRLALAVETNMILESAFDRLVKFPKALIKIVTSINELLRVTPGVRSLSNRTSLHMLELWAIKMTLYGNYPGGPRFAGMQLDERWLDEYTRLFKIDRTTLMRYIENYRRSPKTVQLSYIVSRPQTP